MRLIAAVPAAHKVCVPQPPAHNPSAGPQAGPEPGYFTVTDPCIPTSRCPGRLQYIT